MRIKMQLLSDTIFGSGYTEPGREDISVQTDENGFPFYKGGTFKGVFREALEQYLDWTDNKEKNEIVGMLMGKKGNAFENPRKLVFSDFRLSGGVRKAMLDEGLSEAEIFDALTSMRTFTKIDEESGTAADGSLRTARCVNKGLWFYSEIECSEEDEPMIEDVLGTIKWIGTMRNRGFGMVKISREGRA